MGAVCGDGPYDPLATLQYYCQSRMLSMPVAPALMLKGLCETDEDAIKAGLQVSDFVSDAFYKSGIFARIGSKLYTTDGCEDALREYNKDHPGSFSFIDDKLPTDQALNQATFQYFLDGTEPADPEMLRKLKALKFCLEKNSLFYKFNPATINFDLKIPMPAAFGTGYMTYHIKPQFSFFHGRYDTVVPVDNLFSIMNNWGSGAAKYVQTDRLYDHGQLGEAFFLGLHDELVEEMLNGEWEPALKAYNTSIPNIINTLKGH